MVSLGIVRLNMLGGHLDNSSIKRHTFLRHSRLSELLFQVVLLLARQKFRSSFEYLVDIPFFLRHSLMYEPNAIFS